MRDPEKATKEGSVLRIRIGIALWLASWIPFPLLLQLHGWALVIGIAAQVIMGIVGLALAGSAVANEIRQAGWRQGLRAGWHLFSQNHSKVHAEPE